MMVSRTTLAAAGCALFLLAGCVSTRSNLADSADRLEHNAAALAQDTDRLPADRDYPTGYTRDTEQLAEDARTFRHVADDRDSTDGDVKAAFRRVSRSYLVVRDDVDHSDSRAAREDLKPVTDAYLDLEREVGGYPVRRASAAD
jgi:outer membrane murein-binding lipoprotein Lpp